MHDSKMSTLLAQQKQVKTDRSQVVFVGQNTEMNCLLSRGLNVSSWVYKAIGKTQVFTLYTVEMGLDRDVERFQVSDKADILRIIHTQLEDAGMYSCKALYSEVAGRQILEEVMDLVVLGEFS